MAVSFSTLRPACSVPGPTPGWRRTPGRGRASLGDYLCETPLAEKCNRQAERRLLVLRALPVQKYRRKRIQQRRDRGGIFGQVHQNLTCGEVTAVILLSLSPTTGVIRTSGLSPMESFVCSCFSNSTNTSSNMFRIPTVASTRPECDRHLLLFVFTP